MAATEPTVESIALSARNMLRDFPNFFEVDLGPLQMSTIRLPHPNVDADTLQVYTAAQPGPNGSATNLTMTAVPDDEWVLDERNGLVKFTSSAYQGQRVFVAGYHFEWFITQDLEFNASLVVAEHMFQRTDQTLGTISPVELDVIAMGTVVRALWALVTDFSTDIDVNSPEGMFIPARQRFQQVWQMLQYWEGQYSDRAKSLNVGLSNIDIFNLRRVSRMTNRYVPVYVSREYDDHNPPQRVYPPIPTLVTSEPGSGSGDNEVTVEEIGRESADLGFGGWQSGGTNGGI
jgi:hypothetical protein